MAAKSRGGGLEQIRTGLAAGWVVRVVMATGLPRIVKLDRSAADEAQDMLSMFMVSPRSPSEHQSGESVCQREV